MQNVLRGRKGDSVRHELIKQYDPLKNKAELHIPYGDMRLQGNARKAVNTCAKPAPGRAFKPLPLLSSCQSCYHEAYSKATSRVLYKTRFSKVRVVLNALIRINPPDSNLSVETF